MTAQELINVLPSPDAFLDTYGFMADGKTIYFWFGETPEGLDTNQVGPIELAEEVTWASVWESAQGSDIHFSFYFPAHGVKLRANGVADPVGANYSNSKFIEA